MFQIIKYTPKTGKEFGFYNRTPLDLFYKFSTDGFKTVQRMQNNQNPYNLVRYELIRVSAEPKFIKDWEI